jgi:hypothetical protein
VSSELSNIRQELENSLNSLFEGVKTNKQPVLVKESRPTHVYRDFVSHNIKNPVVDKVIDDYALPDGHTILLRTKDGNAYEVTIRPAQYSKKFADKTKKSNLDK